MKWGACFGCFLGVFGFFGMEAFGQEEDTDFLKLPLKIVEVSYESLVDFNTVSTSELLGDYEAEMRQNERLRAELTLPILLKDSLLMGVQLKYVREEFYFENPSELEYPIYQQLEDRALNSLGVKWLFQKKLPKTGKSWQGYAGFELNGDRFQTRQLGYYLKLSLALIYMNRVSERTELGYGIRFGYDLGIPLILPLFTYSHHFNRRLSTNLTLPKEAGLTYAFNKGTFLTAKAEISGASYHIRNADFPGFDELETRKSEGRLSVGLGKKVHDWFWLEANAGMVKFLNFFVSEPLKGRRDALIELSANEALFFNTKILITVPEKLKRKLR